MMASMPVALIPFLQNRCGAAESSRLRADSSSPAGDDFFFATDLPALLMSLSKSDHAEIIKPLVHCAQNNRLRAATAFRLSSARLVTSRACQPKPLHCFAF